MKNQYIIYITPRFNSILGRQLMLLQNQQKSQHVRVGTIPTLKGAVN